MDTPYGSEPLAIWERPEPQPRAAPVPLSRAKIVAVAIRLADEQGLDGLSIRKIAKELGVGPMRLYDYVTNRAELLDLMVDAVYGQIADASGQTAQTGGRAAETGGQRVEAGGRAAETGGQRVETGGRAAGAGRRRVAGAGEQAEWRATVLAVARATRVAALEHEWFADLLGGRPHLGPHTLAVGELNAAALSQAPAVHDIDDLQRTIGALNSFLIGALRREVTERRTARTTGTDVPAFQAGLGPYLTRMFTTGRYPTIARLVVDGSHLDAEETFNRTLTTVLDGITGAPA
ncbi:TetR/AcrR family transcriptional regulator [Winogradskya humida]|uniref:TetR/AcrR family transcriptional regulator n=1 Tax=Winogradskya humida TaxID=113566 RepID=UPI001EF2639E|nr:TetR/AcrR family transcriptional regulator [Actinoplanes humidus]